MDVSTRINHKIMMVDDCPEDRELYKRFLIRSPILTFEFSEAEMIGEGLEICKEFRPDCVLLDYMLPDGTGLEFLERFNSIFAHHEAGVIMLTGQGSEEVVVNALKLGARDYMNKGRINAEGLCRAVYMALEKTQLLRELHEQHLGKDRLISQLQEALAQVKRLSGLLPICANCKKIRNDKGYWQQVEVYVRNHSEADFSHCICPACLKELYPQIADQILQKQAEKQRNSPKKTSKEMTGRNNEL
jgi:CheY-like chemotaxis protein